MQLMHYLTLLLLQGVSFGVADGVGGWIDQGVDPSLFAQALMYHAHRYSKTAWAGEAETDPTQEYAEREAVDGWELTPVQCLQLAYDAVMRERGVLAGSSHRFIHSVLDWLKISSHRIKYRLYPQPECILGSPSSSKVRAFSHCPFVSILVLTVSSLGDSGFVVIRSSQVIHTQHPQTHFFNCPRSVSVLKKSLSSNFSLIGLLAQATNKGASYGEESPQYTIYQRLSIRCRHLRDKTPRRRSGHRIRS